ncbi:MFS transporter [Cohnella cellulosilytica]|uniref:MFS transporter n=1 Tax=Cohnella cellulosilytica TaxID=986710 RepID=A0ABW2F5W9_9BACL
MPWIVFFQFMQSFNENMFQIISPSIADEFGITKATVSLVVTSSGLIVGIGAAVYATLTDKFSMKQLFVFGIITLSIGSIFGFIMHDWFFTVVLGRVVQCIGSACITGCYIIFITKYFPKKEQPKYIGFIPVMYQLSAGLGAAIGGMLAGYISWTFSYLLPIVTILALPFFLKYLPDDRGQKDKQVDIVGAIWMTVCVSLLILSITFLNVYGIVISILMFGYYTWRANRHRYPFFNFSLLKIPRFKMTLTITVLVFGAHSCMMFMFPFVMKETYGLSTVEVGFLFVSSTIPAIIAGIVVNRTIHRFGINKMFYMGCLLFISSSLLFALFMGKSIYFAWFSFMLFTLSYPFIFTGFVSSVTRLLPKDKIGAGMGIYFLAVGCGRSIPVSIVGLMLTHHTFDQQIIPIISGDNDMYVYSNIYLLLAILLGVGWILFRLAHGKERRD